MLVFKRLRILEIWHNEGIIRIEMAFLPSKYDVRIPLLPPSPSSYLVIFLATPTLPPRADVICTCPLKAVG